LIVRPPGHLLRLSRGLLAASAHHGPHRVDLRHHSTTNCQDPKLPQRQDHLELGAPTGHKCSEALPTPLGVRSARWP